MRKLYIQILMIICCIVAAYDSTCSAPTTPPPATPRIISGPPPLPPRQITNRAESDSENDTQPAEYTTTGQVIMHRRHLACARRLFAPVPSLEKHEERLAMEILKEDDQVDKRAAKRRRRDEEQPKLLTMAIATIQNNMVSSTRDQEQMYRNLRYGRRPSFLPMINSALPCTKELCALLQVPNKTADALIAWSKEEMALQGRPEDTASFFISSSRIQRSNERRALETLGFM